MANLPKLTVLVNALKKLSFRILSRFQPCLNYKPKFYLNDVSADLFFLLSWYSSNSLTFFRKISIFTYFLVFFYQSPKGFEGFLLIDLLGFLLPSPTRVWRFFYLHLYQQLRLVSIYILVRACVLKKRKLQKHSHRTWSLDLLIWHDTQTYLIWSYDSSLSLTATTLGLTTLNFTILFLTQP